MHTVIGHVHSFAGIRYLTTVGSTIWGMNCGCLVDNSHIAFAYGKDMRNKPVSALGVIINNVPMLIPMFTDENGRWIKESASLCACGNPLERSGKYSRSTCRTCRRNG